MRHYTWIFIIIFSLFSCDYGECVHIVNGTKDTILIGNANCNNIDSIHNFLPRRGAIFDYTYTEKQHDGKMKISNCDIIYPDSAGTYGVLNQPLFYSNFHRKGYFFIIRLTTARNHTWNEIVEKRLYDILIVTQEMIKDTNVVMYSPIKNITCRQPCAYSLTATTGHL